MPPREALDQETGGDLPCQCSAGDQGHHAVRTPRRGDRVKTDPELPENHAPVDDDPDVEQRWRQGRITLQETVEAHQYRRDDAVSRGQQAACRDSLAKPVRTGEQQREQHGRGDVDVRQMVQIEAGQQNGVAYGLGRDVGKHQQEVGQSQGEQRA